MAKGLHRRQVLQVMGGAALAAGVTGCGREAFDVSLDTELPVGPGCAETTADDVIADVDLSGRVALVTGCNSGLGFETLRVLAGRGHSLEAILPALPHALKTVRGETEDCGG